MAHAPFGFVCGLMALGKQVHPGADDFIEKTGQFRMHGIMLAHYSAAVLFSEQARRAFIVESDLDRMALT